MSSKGGNASWKKILILFGLAITIKIFSLFPALVEEWYSLKIYPLISISLRWLTGWLPFSLGDVLYGATALWILIRIYKTLKAVFKRKVTKQGFGNSFRRTLTIALWIYLLFNLLWGINYERLGIAYQLKLEPAEYSTPELKDLTGSLIQKTNSERLRLGESYTYPSSKEIFREAKEAYDSAGIKYSFLRYAVPSVKSSLFGRLESYLGTLGYYNPFTGEAQVNTAIPSFLVPYTVCHEIGHQLGYGTEDEANFSGYLAAKSSKESGFRYSVYLDLFLYANRELYSRDSLLAKHNFKSLDTLVRKDIAIYRKFLETHENPIEPYITVLYGKYLEANNQPNGMETYNEVIGWLIAYRKKYGEL
ncbi:MAG: DUF3810 domain-containing protein [Panacibacter sp.]